MIEAMTGRHLRGTAARRTRLGLLAGVASACALAAAPPAALAATQSLQVQAAPGAQATRPEAITATGSVGVPSTITIYAQLAGPPCAAQAGVEAARGATLVDQRPVNGPFAFAASFTPATAGTYFICTYLDGSASGMTEHQNQSSEISVAAPPPPPPASTPPPPPPLAGSIGAQCHVPSLRRHTLGYARHLLVLAGCKLGRVYYPSARALRAARRRAHGRTPSLIVVSQTPGVGSVHVAGYTVAVRLGLGPAPRSGATNP
jgi:hypothetical protein